MKVYVVMAGYYHEEHVKAVCTDQEKAERLRKYYANTDGGAYIEEYDTEAQEPEGTYDLVSAYEITIGNGDAYQKAKHKYVPANTPPTIVHHIDCKEKPPIHWYVINVIAEDEIQAFRLAIEMVDKYRAEKENLSERL